MSDPELIFHDTVPQPEERLGEAREKAMRQNAIILDFFQTYKGNYTPYEVWEYFQRFEGDILLTSVRRSITNLTKSGRLIKCQWSESKEGKYGKLNRTWKYNKDYVPPLNPKK